MKRGRSSKGGASAAKRRQIAAAALVSLSKGAGGRRAMNARTGGFLGIETKFYDTALADTALATNTAGAGGELDPTADTISAPAQGDGEENRDGNRILLKSAFVNGMINLSAQTNQTAADGAMGWSVYLVHDKQSNGATLNSEDVFVNPTGSALGGATLLRNLQYSTRFRVLAKAHGTIDQPNMSYDGTNIEVGGVQRQFTLGWKGDMPVQFKGGATAAGITGVADNSLHIIGFTTSTGMAPKITYNARVRFQG